MYDVGIISVGGCLESYVLLEETEAYTPWLLQTQKHRRMFIAIDETALLQCITNCVITLH